MRKIVDILYPFFLNIIILVSYLWDKLLAVNSFLDSIKLSYFSIGILGFTWGLVESLGLYALIPDVLFCFIAVFSFRKSLWTVFWGLLGAMCGASFLYFYLTYREIGSGLLWESFINPFGSFIVSKIKMNFFVPKAIVLVDSHFQKYGVKAIYYGWEYFLPFRMYVVRAHELGYSYLSVLMVTPYARLGRFLKYPTIVLIIKLSMRLAAKIIYSISKKNIIPWTLILLVILFFKWFGGYNRFFSYVMLNYDIYIDFYTLLNPFGTLKRQTKI